MSSSGGENDRGYRLLEWDSGFFGFGVARLTVPTADTAGMAGIIDMLRSRGVSLAYWATDPGDAGAQLAACSNGGWLADEKATYVIGLRALPPDGIPPPEAEISEYRSNEVDDALYRLALQSGVHSRFRIDPRFPPGAFERLYREWMRRSVGGELARAVLVAGPAGRISGMLTVGEQGGRGDIGLVAVDQAARGRHVGTSLVRAALRWFVGNGYQSAQVVTQRANAHACRLYRACGFEIEQIRNVYHFWL